MANQGPSREDLHRVLEGEEADVSHDASIAGVHGGRAMAVKLPTIRGPFSCARVIRQGGWPKDVWVLDACVAVTFFRRN